MIRMWWTFSLLLLLTACGSVQETVPIIYTGNATPVWGPSNGDASRGLVLAKKLCATCHLVDGEGIVFPGAAPFEQTAARQELTTTYLRGWLANPLMQKPGTLMPNLGLSTEQIEDLIAYLYTLRPE